MLLMQLCKQASVAVFVSKNEYNKILLRFFVQMARVCICQ